MIKICIGGSKGKMGVRISSLAKDDPEFEVAREFDVGDDARNAIEGSECLIEFTLPEATIEHIEICRSLKKPIVIGTTGFNDNQKELIKEAAKEIPVVLSPNMSVGVNLMFKMAKDAAKALGSDYSIEIVEAHHVHKKDSPSGTAKEIARLIKEEASGSDAPIESIREGEVIGEHTVKFESDVDLIEITHSAKTRDIFAKGALQAAKFVVRKPAGLYSMADVLSF